MRISSVTIFKLKIFLNLREIFEKSDEESFFIRYEAELDFFLKIIIPITRTAKIAKLI